MTSEETPPPYTSPDQVNANLPDATYISLEEQLSMFEFHRDSVDNQNKSDLLYIQITLKNCIGQQTILGNIPYPYRPLLYTAIDLLIEQIKQEPKTIKILLDFLKK